MVCARCGAEEAVFEVRSDIMRQAVCADCAAVAQALKNRQSSQVQGAIEIVRLAAKSEAA